MAEDAGFETNIEHKNKGCGMSQNIDLFRKYLLTKSENHNFGKTNKEESDVIKKKSPTGALIPLIMPSNFDNFSRPLSLLERELVTEIRSDEIQTSSSKRGKSSKAQLTIFYAGVINVYDDVPNDKAQAIMLLAGERSLSKPITANEKLKTEAKTPLPRPNIESSCKLQADLPIARKISLQHFVQKRNRRIANNSPYATAANSIINRDQDEDNDLNLDDHISKENNPSISLSPFPSRLGYFLPVPTKRF
ncbi:hypothetical protein REPUB_Repub04eG0012600 [Reevesia pubescens]